MNSRFTELVGSDDLTIIPRTSKQIYSTGSFSQGLNTSCIEFDRKLARSMHSYLLSHCRSDFRFLKVPEDLISIVGNELKRYACAVQAYVDAYPTTAYHSKIELIDGLLNKNFASYLKRLKTKAFIQSCDLRQYEKPDWWESIPSPNVSEIGQIFNYSYCFFWKEEAENDYLKGFLPCKRISKPDMELYKKTLLGLLPENISEVKPDEVLLGLSSSSTLSRKAHWEEAENEANLSFSRKPLRGGRCIIPVGPSNTRDSILLSPPQSNTVKFIELQCKEICENIAFSLFFRRPERFEKHLRKFRSDFSYFFDRDLTKEGITKPRELVVATLEVLYEFYGYEAFSYSEIYSSYILELEDSIVYPTRGHGLGMANALTTIIQCTIFKIIQEDMYDKNIILEDCSAIFYNDDCSVGFSCEEDLENYIDYEDEYLERYRLIRNMKKSHGGTATVFCEIYYPDKFNDKKSYDLNGIYNIFSCHNIVHAKEVANSVLTGLTVIQYADVMQDIIRFWGYEFIPSEAGQPGLLGGWISPKFLNIRLDFLYIEKMSREMYSLYLASNAEDRMIDYRYIRNNDVYISPILRKYGPDLSIEPRDHLVYMETKRKVSSLFMKRNNRRIVEDYYDFLLCKRNKIFNDYQSSTNLSVKEFYCEVYSKYPEIDFLPRREFAKEEYIDIEDLEEESFFRPPNPNLSRIRCNNLTFDLIPKEILPICSFSENFVKDSYSFHKIWSGVKKMEHHNPSLLVAKENYDDLRIYRFPKEYYNIFNDPASVNSVYSFYYCSKIEKCCVSVPDLDVKNKISNINYMLRSKSFHSLIKPFLNGLTIKNYTIIEESDETFVKDTFAHFSDIYGSIRKDYESQMLFERKETDSAEGRKDSEKKFTSYWNWTSGQEMPRNSEEERVLQEIDLFFRLGLHPLDSVGPRGGGIVIHFCPTAVGIMESSNISYHTKYDNDIGLLIEIDPEPPDAFDDDDTFGILW